MLDIWIYSHSLVKNYAEELYSLLHWLRQQVAESGPLYIGAS